MSNTLKQKIPIDRKAKVDLSVRSPKDDFTLIVDGKNIYVPKLMLILASPVFDRMLNSDFKESNKNEIELTDKKYEDVLKFVECIHPRLLTPISMDNVFSVLPLANEYLVEHMKEHCESVLCADASTNASVDTLCNYLSIAHKFQLRDLEEKCRELAGEKSTNSYRSQFSTGAEKYAVSFESQAKVYKKMLDTQSKNTISEMNKFWGSYCRQCTNSDTISNLKTAVEKQL